MHRRLQDNQSEYAELLKNLLIQGLIKLIEPRVTLRCRKSDVNVLQGVIDDAIEQYKRLMLAQVKALQGKEDIPCKVTIDEEHFLHEYDENNPTQSCLGGFVIFAKKNRIVCSQTLDDRLSMAYQHAIPQMRANLFPSITKPAK